MAGNVVRGLKGTVEGGSKYVADSGGTAEMVGELLGLLMTPFC